MPDADGRLIEARGITLAFGGHLVLDEVNTDVNEGEVLTVVGPNGAGKTTLVRVLLGLQAPQSGTVTRREGVRIGYMPQRLSIDRSLPMTVRRFLQFAEKDEARLVATLSEVGAPDRLDSPFQDLSGGEMQRVLLARALLREPDLLVLDEPLSGVDAQGQAELYRLISDIRDARGCGVLMVSHDLHLVMASTDRVICLNRRVECGGHPEAIVKHPGYVALFGDAATASAFAVYRHHPGHEQLPDGTLRALHPDHDPEGCPEPDCHG